MNDNESWRELLSALRFSSEDLSVDDIRNTKYTVKGEIRLTFRLFLADVIEIFIVTPT